MTKPTQNNDLGFIPALAAAVAGDSKNIDKVSKVVGDVVKIGFGLSVVVGTFYLSRMLIRDINRKRSDMQAIIPGTDEYYAGRIGNAINTNSFWSIVSDDDEEGLYRTLQEIPQGHADGVEKAFYRRYNKTLVSEFDRALSALERTKALGILNQKRN